MPIWLRNFTYKQIIDYKQQEQEAYKNISKGKNSSANIGDDNLPPHIKQALTNPPSTSYKTKTSKK
jgi:hypothetical protein|tara:strand:- start:612 stop:809 length:198 start_codon:yes stop_codon:yes gene_type:complete